MGRALALAEEAFKKGEVPVGAVIVCRNRIIARAHNLTEALTDVTAHAEMQAITMSANELGGKYLQDCTLYVTVEPCIMCAGALGWSQIKRVVYGCSDEKRGFSAFAPQALHSKTNRNKGRSGRRMQKANAAVLQGTKISRNRLKSHTVGIKFGRKLPSFCKENLVKK